jgi:hypothetical protein
MVYPHWLMKTVGYLVGGRGEKRSGVAKWVDIAGLEVISLCLVSINY